jgi:hypothetical protein
MLFSGTLGSPDPAAQPLTLSNSGTGDWNGSVTVDPSSPWISVTPAARLSVSAAIGANPGTLPVQVSVAMAGLSAGPPHTGLLHFDDGAGHTLPVTVNFTVNPQPVPKPDLVSLDPQIITAGDPPFTLLISGSNILSGATVSWGGTVKIPDAIDSSGAWLKLTIQPSDIPTPGYIQITATNPGGSPSNALPLRVVAPPKVPDLRLGPYTPLNATLSVSPQQDILFNWAVTPLASLPNSTALGIQSGNSALDNAPFKSFSAPPALSLGNFPLSVGPISVEVTATNLAGKTSAPAQAFTILTSNNADVFPNPWRADQHAGHPITFRPVTPGDTLKIFTLSGRLVNTLSVTDTFAAWSPEADRAASGVYFYTLTDSQGLQNRGKFAVIR